MEIVGLRPGQALPDSSDAASRIVPQPGFRSQAQVQADNAAHEAATVKPEHASIHAKLDAVMDALGAKVKDEEPAGSHGIGKEEGEAQGSGSERYGDSWNQGQAGSAHDDYGIVKEYLAQSAHPDAPQQGGLTQPFVAKQVPIVRPGGFGGFDVVLGDKLIGCFPNVEEANEFAVKTDREGEIPAVE
jgi:hypothetical protein